MLAPRYHSAMRNVGPARVAMGVRTIFNLLGPLTNPAPQVNLLAPGQEYGPRIRQWDLSAKKIIRFGSQRLTAGVDIYNVTNNNVTLLFNPTFAAGVAGWQSPTQYMNPRVYRLNAEFAF